MGLVSADITLIQAKLHDGGAIWTSAELLRWYNDGYRTLLYESAALRRFQISDMPGRFTFATMYEWESRHTLGGSFWRANLLSHDSSMGSTAAWETEFLEGLTPDDTLSGITQPWEWAYQTNDRHFRFALPRKHERLVHVAWDDKVVLPIEVRELDEFESRWMEQPGRPDWWTPGIGRNNTFEIYEIDSTYVQGYELRGLYGTVGEVTGSRTYSVRADKETGQPNDYAFSSDGDADAIGRARHRFYAPYAFTNESDSMDGRYGLYQFTIPDHGYQRSCTQVWEVVSPHLNSLGAAAVGQARGMWPWEAPYLNALVPVSTDGPIRMRGLGYRFTKANNAETYNPTQQWEKEHLDGDTLTAGTVVGTYAWEHQHPVDGVSSTEYSFGLGTIEGISSPDRQYLVTGLHLPYGVVREFKSSADALTMLYVAVPDGDLATSDIPDTIPPQLQKYLRFYALSRAFGRQGEGHSSIIAAHYERRFRMGVALMRKLQDLALTDRVFVREPMSVKDRKPPRVRLDPTHFERVLY